MLDFRYRNQRCREVLSNLPVTKSNIKFAARLRATILTEIAQGTFDYAHRFPDSPNAVLFSGPSAQKKTVEEALTEWLAIQKPQIAASSYRTYKDRANAYLTPRFGTWQISELNRTHIELWRTELSAYLANKTINEVTLILRALLSAAKADRIISYNPMEDIRNLSEHHDEPDPFTREEIERILSVPTHYQQEQTMMQFAFWSGVRLSELICVAWEDVDWAKGTIRVRRACVQQVYKVPKTKRSVRTVELTAPAIEALRAQRTRTEANRAATVTVVQSDNKTRRKEELRFIFLRTLDGAPYPSGDALRKQFWVNHLKKAKIRYRGPNHTRHTFVSQMLTAGMPKDWIAMQCGHTSTAMIDRYYGKWMTGEAPNMARLVNEKFGFTQHPAEPAQDDDSHNPAR